MAAAESGKKRTNYLPWDEYFMAIAFLSAKRSKDPSSQVGAVIVDQDKKIVGIGYNGMPIGCDDDVMPWARKADSVLDTKYPYVCHAEMNAILNKNSASLKDCSIYVALFPCNECAKLIIQSGIKRVIYVSDKYHKELPFIASRRLLDTAGVTTIQFVPKQKRIVVDFDEILGIPELLQRSESASAPAPPPGSSGHHPAATLLEAQSVASSSQLRARGNSSGNSQRSASVGPQEPAASTEASAPAAPAPAPAAPQQEADSSEKEGNSPENTDDILASTPVGQPVSSTGDCVIA